MKDHLFVICDKENKVATIAGIIMFGVKVDMPAIFCEEENALSVLFELEESGLVEDTPHAVRKINSGFTGQIG